MNNEDSILHRTMDKPTQRRNVLKLATSVTMAMLMASTLIACKVIATEPTTQKVNTMKHKAYVYTELQISAPFKNVPWQRINKEIKKQPGFINKTWLAGIGNHSAGGFYVFDSIEDAQKFVTGYFPEEARGFGVAQTTRVFNAVVTEEASRDMNSVYYDGKIIQKPGAFVYTELQVNATPFDETVPWRKRNPTLKKQPGLLAKTWLSGLHTGTPGGLYAFDTIENVQNFAVNYFPKEAASLNAAFYTRVFDANITEAASRDMNSPFYN